MPNDDIWVDAAFNMTGASIPIDHGYALFSAVSRIVPVLHDEPAWGVHPIRGVRVAHDSLRLDRSSLLKLRLPAQRVADVLAIAGKTLDIGPHRVGVGVPSLFPLAPGDSLRARVVVIKNAVGDSTMFLDSFRRRLSAIDALGQDPERIDVEVGRRRVLKIASHVVVGYAVSLAGLESTASLAIQRQGIGGRRHMGAGLFVPPGRA